MAITWVLWRKMPARLLARIISPGSPKSDQGHILVRVEPGGAQYTVIILDDRAESFIVKAVHGPYTSR